MDSYPIEFRPKCNIFNTFALLIFEHDDSVRADSVSVAPIKLSLYVKRSNSFNFFFSLALKNKEICRIQLIWKEREEKNGQQIFRFVVGDIQLINEFRLLFYFLNLSHCVLIAIGAIRA